MPDPSEKFHRPKYKSTTAQETASDEGNDNVRWVISRTNTMIVCKKRSNIVPTFPPQAEELLTRSTNGRGRCSKFVPESGGGAAQKQPSRGQI